MEEFKLIFSIVWILVVGGGLVFSIIGLFAKIFDDNFREDKNDDYNQDDM